MSFGIIIRRKDRRFLGTADEVKQAILRAFPGTNFVATPVLPPSRKAGFGLYRFIRWLNARPPLPGCVGSFEGEDFALQFDLGSNTQLRYVPVDSYGRGRTMIPHFENLERETGWTVEVLGFLDLVA